MRTVASENVITFVKKLGVGTQVIDLEVELAIDRFDQWSNPENPLVLVTNTMCAGADR
ncbi:hypothetical protein [Amycolatopsis nigrescens]|uniref:hypothetical protein n=1 Tax=Amycolatopsis nigrescens TaxID=381445 RepID=UPI00036CF0AD|nr:hypothetical protein [Amycolatopsis nigrescens]